MYERYKLTDKDIERLDNRLNHHKKVIAIKLLIETSLTQEQIAELTGIQRMTLYRWRKNDRNFIREHDRLFDKAIKHMQKSLRKYRRYTVDDILGNQTLLNSLFKRF